jgi:putative oxidoreductase
MAGGRLALRSVVGGLMVGHGLQKLQGKFDGPGLQGTEQMMSSIGMHPARYQAYAAALSETVGGGLTAAGFLNPIGPAMIIGTMAVAIKKVHAPNGPWVTKGGFEYNLVLIAAAFASAAEGPGPVSLDGLRGKSGGGVLKGLLALGLGLGAAAGALAAADKMGPSDSSGTAPAPAGQGAVTEAPAGEDPTTEL